MKAILSCALVLSSATLLPAAPAIAQSGSRICGYTSTNDEGNIGFVYEARTTSNTYGKDCREANDAFWTKIQADPALKRLQWIRREKISCEDAGALFKSKTHPNDDLCFYTTGQSSNKVQRNTAKDSTSITVL